jgi:Flp pilus assembly protein TadD
MKKIILSVGLIFSCSALFAQSIEQGRQELYYKKYQTAAKTFQTALQQKPEDGEALYGLVYAWLHADEPEKARQSLQQFSSAAQTNPYYKTALGYILLSEGKKDSAAIYFTQALDATKEKDAGVLAAVAQAEIEAKEGDANYALQLLEKAMKRDKRNADLYVFRGDAYRKLDNGTEAFRAYQEALEKNDKLAVASYQL